MVQVAFETSNRNLRPSFPLIRRLLLLLTMRTTKRLLLLRIFSLLLLFFPCTVCFILPPPSSKTSILQSVIMNTANPASERKTPAVPWSAFVAVTAVALPVWSVTVLPLAIAYQLGRRIIGKTPPQITIDSGYQVDHIVDRAKRPYDIVVLGATGFVGKLAVRHLAQAYTDGSVRWAIAGRNETKLKGVLQELADELQKPELLKIPVIVVDTSVPATMPKLVSSTRAIATTTGPYALLGNSVVEFCAKHGTHYVDITGEIPWVQAMMDHWQATAEQTGAIMMPLCGHDSVPWDLLVQQMQQELQKNGEELEQVECWDFAKAAAPGGTLATMFSMLEGKVQLPKLQTDPFRRLPDGSYSQTKTTADLPLRLTNRRSPVGSVWSMPFVMAPVNAAVVKWSQAQRQHKAELVYRETAACADWKSAVTMYVGMIMFGGLLMNPITSYLLKKYALPKSGEGPALKDMFEKHFLNIHASGVGSKGSVVHAQWYWSQDAGCWETAKSLVESGLCLALNQAPVTKGGFYSPSLALGDSLLERLRKQGTYFSCSVVEPRAKL